jgi:hypothetical protein
MNGAHIEPRLAPTIAIARDGNLSFRHLSPATRGTMSSIQIRHFAAVVETGSITKAAIRAAVSQPALSVSIAKLEEELGVRCSSAHTEVGHSHTSGPSISFDRAGDSAGVQHGEG